MIVTRCPHCQTGFRITPEQIKACDGRVRCGECQQVFDAVENLITAQGIPPEPALPPPETVPERVHPEIPAFLIPSTPRSDPAGEPPPEASEPAPPDPVTPAPAPAEAPAEPVMLPESPAPAASRDADEAPARAREAGLSAARDSSEIRGFNKWSEGTLTSSGAVFADPPRIVRWPYVLAALIFATTLAGQVALQFRSELVARVPAVRPLLAALCEVAACRIGLPRDAEQIGIESSELQSDPERGGLLVLVATLRNRAPFDQDFPSLELALTDTRDQPIVRKVLSPPDYLPASTLARGGFVAGSDQSIRLWLDGKAIGAAGYRLYVFYP